MKTKGLLRCLALGMTVFLSDPAHATSGSFSTFTYNIAGLPEVLSSATSARQDATERISCYVKQFDFVNVQEDFNYHAALYDTCDDHPYRSPTSGGAGIGSGLNSMSRFPYMDWERVSWNNCNGVDCLTPKGFTIARTRLAEGVYVDIYNLHTQAQIEDADLVARREDILQILGYIETHSAGNAVIVMGDTNTRYTRSGDNMWEFLRRGFTDVWVSKVRHGDVPAEGTAALVCSPAYTSPNCEVVDKVLFRDNGFVGLQALSFLIPTDTQNAAGEELSDHRGIKTTWSYSTASNRQLSDVWGGPHGIAFNDVYSLPDNPAVSTLTIRSGNRVDRVEVTLSNGYIFSHGGTGGTESSLPLASNEYLTSLYLCSGSYNNTTRIFYTRFTTSAGRSLAGGKATSNCTTYTAPSGWQIVGFHGRAGDEVDKLGVVYAPQVSKPAAAIYHQFVNRNSGRCLGISNGTMANGTQVQQWACDGGDWQKWSYDARSGLIRSKKDPRYCLDNGGSFSNGARIQLWTCNGNANQRFTVDTAAGTVRMRTHPEQALEVYNLGTADGANVDTWTFWGGPGQLWNLTP
ncbi:RICIN domain-containing protein [Archangium violaceum]|uniref:RICIN domain-containing protein n=1 Tax=Archangium violaceum TaxID=83451 RepID=UPI00193AEB70|nr:RICIN domain-containing protein [Archangium violaceum]QRK10898.1 RICIN domain-containing protein [Archangium violaceum]